ncbi:MAG: head-tail connector protein [Holosporales bacterium]|jgi:uncharacterized phiE125 gp8 family phage protein|nr:head-tail connector protein [Holosporales bacterium]
MNIIIEQSKKQPLAIDVLKAHLRIDHNHEDGYLRNIIDMAVEILETNIEKPILKKKYKYIHYNDEFTSSRKIALPVSEVRNVISVRKLLPDKKPDDFSYNIENYNGKTIIITTGIRRPIEIVYTAGITGNPAKIPKDLQFAILQISKNIYECAEEDVLESKYIKHIINSHRTATLD